jgi:hypothetical protein
MKFNRLTRTLIAGGAAAVVAVTTGGFAAAANSQPTSPTVFQGCLSHLIETTYNLHLNPSASPKCFKGDTQVSWNQTGPAGSAGPQGPAGPTQTESTATTTQPVTTVGYGQSAAAFCATGTVTGGGYRFAQGDSTGAGAGKIQQTNVTGAYPASLITSGTGAGKLTPAQPGTPANAWVISYDVTASNSGTLTVYAECAS